MPDSRVYDEARAEEAFRKLKALFAAAL